MVIPEPRALRIPMRDGVELLGDVYLPRPDGSFPTLLCKSPYDRKRPARYAEIATFLDHGYAVVIASFRGRHGSEGKFNEWTTEGWGEHQDGYDTIEWVAAQPWSDGMVGTYGISADGQWQLSTAPTQPPHLKAMCTSYAADGRTCVENGMFTSTFPRWHAMNDVFAVDLGQRDDWQAWLDGWRASGAPLLASFIHPGLLESMAGVADDEYWAAFDPATRYADFDVPVLYECGWYDRYTAVQIRHFLGVNAHGGPGARGKQKLICGPWVHGGNLAPETEGVRFPAHARTRRIDLQVRWFDHWLKGEDTGIMEEPPLSVYVTGGHEWLESTTWPPPGVGERSYHLAASGPATPGASLHDGGLVVGPPADDEPPVSYLHDPYDPVPTIGGHGGVGWMWPAGPLDQAEPEARSITYTTETLSEAVEVVGDPVVELQASSSAVDTDFVVTLADVHPSGYSQIIVQGAVRARHRKAPGSTDLLEPGTVYPIRLELSAVAHRFQPGHRIRIAVASSSFPGFLPNPGTAEPAYLATRGVTATNTIHHDAEHRSRLVLPVRSL
jgi:putative CocE/NonD family hydrolase